MDRLLELTRRAEASHFWFRGFRRFVTPVLDAAASGARDLSVLDCGCGTGHNLRQLSRYGVAIGIDVTAAGVALAREAGHAVARADVTRLPFASARFDLVTSFDVLQCVPDDRAAAREIARVLKTGGRFVGTVAAMDVLHGDHSVLSEEVRRYTRGRLRALLRENGFEPALVRYAFASLFPMMLAVRATQRLRGARATGSEIALPPAPINSALSVLLRAEAGMASRIAMPFGSSLVFAATKI